MANIPFRREERNTGEIFNDMISDLQALLRQEIAFAKSQLAAEWNRAKLALFFTAAAFLAFASGVVLLGVSIAGLLVELGLPMWVSTGVLAILFLAAGMFFFSRSPAAKEEIQKWPPKLKQLNTK